MPWVQSLSDGIINIWSIKEIKIFFLVAVVGSILYFSIVHAKTIFSWLIGIIKSEKKKQADPARFYKPDPDKNFQIYREYVQWTEKPLLAFKIRRIIVERAIYTVLILLLIALILKGFF